MNYPPPTSPAPAAARNRRSQRNAAPARHRRASTHRGRRPGRKTKAGLAAWQWLVLSALLIGLIAALVSLGRANASLDALEKERRAAEEKYAQEVRSHQVRYRDLIEYYAAVYQLDPAYVAAIIKRESDYDPRAVSRVGAKGLMQFMPDTFDWVAPNCGISKKNQDAVYEPENAIKMGCYLLNYICRKMGTDDPILVACAYHAGWGNVQGWVQKYSTDGKTLTLSQIPKEDTRYYAGKVLNAYAIYQQHYY